MLDQTDSQVIWRPIPNTSQSLALDTRCNHTLYTGARGPGKTDTQLMRFRRRVGQGYGQFWRGIIFDREYKNLADLVVKSKRWFYAFADGAKFHESMSAYKWVWPSGEELLFRTADKENDYWNYHGHEYPYIGWNELTKYPNADLYDMMMSTNRSSFKPENYPITIDGNLYKATGEVSEVSAKHKNAIKHFLPAIPLEVFSTCNPYGAGHGWVKRRFIDPVEYGQVLTTELKVIDPASKKEVTVKKTQVTIFGSWVENIYLDASYIATLQMEKDENRRKAWLSGDWDIVAGGAFDDVWNKKVHVISRFKIPKTWRIDRAFDWGSSHPFSVGWFAETNGEEALIYTANGVERFCPPRGTLIQIYEWYGTQELGTNKGLKMSATKIAQGIIEIEVALMQSGWIDTQPYAGPADNQISNVNEIDVETIAEKMSKLGVKWTSSDKSPGSRKNGLQLCRDRLEASQLGEGPGLYFMDCCRASISTIPTLPRDKLKIDDVDTSAEDHPYDMVRYRVLKSSNASASNIQFTFAS
jgi:hypothetical protein